MSEQELLDLGFERCEEDGLNFSEDFDAVSADGAYHYYYHHIADGLGLISNESDDLMDGMWYVEVFDTDPRIRFMNKKEVLDFLSIIKKGLSNVTCYET